MLRRWVITHGRGSIDHWYRSHLNIDGARVVTYAKLFRNGRSQAVRLPKEFRFAGERVRVRRVTGGGVLLEPVANDVQAWFATMDRVADGPFMADGREQPAMPEGDEVGLG